MTHPTWGLRERRRQIHVGMLLILINDLLVIFGWLVLRAFATLRRVHKFLIGPLVVTRTVLGSAVPVRTLMHSVLTRSSIHTFLNFEISCHFRLHLLVSLGRLPHMPLIIRVFLYLMHSFFDNVWSSELPDLPLIISILPHPIYLVIVLALRLWFHLCSLMRV